MGIVSEPGSVVGLVENISLNHGATSQPFGNVIERVANADCGSVRCPNGLGGDAGTGCGALRVADAVSAGMNT